jgi:glycosyltransferase involved in cell wall biosynthesis
MKPGQRLVAWQPVLTDHMAYTLQALSRQSGRPLVVYVSRLQDAVRQQQGWTDAQVLHAERRLLPARCGLRHRYRLLREHRADIHLFGSPFEQPAMILTLLAAALLGCEFYLVSEPYSPATEGYFHDRAPWRNRLKALLRPLVYRGYGRLLGLRLQGVFAISSLAVAQYGRIGVPADKLFPFGYFVPKLASAPASAVDAAAAGLRIVFVASLIRRKGLDLLLAAVRRLRTEGHEVGVDVYGPGTPDASQFDAAQVRYRGLIAFGQAQAVIARYDLLVLPSRYDGWGVVVNEALLAQVPVVCSDQVGARVLVERFGAGAVFESGNADALHALLSALLLDPGRLARMRAAAAVAAAAIEPEVAARYMLAVIDAEPRLRAAVASPWYPPQPTSHV